ncbi:MAG: hypothetical protein IJU92_04060 [Spirochaetaceae bacterium]|nr:hypothetical protein [Spirochaetaceae bacterium]
MKALYCDLCGKELVDQIAERTYWHIKEYDVCEDCKEKIEFKLRPLVRNHFPYSQAWFENEFVNLLEKTAASQQ